ncbi:hypothetical protein A2316_01650 [Candidatus Falkowbacteria bacterium RIFOXYB2_FULL_38_15]|uniref:Cohesin domain-containing protein n=1 Tax=Candidatus Falkowbacteria bacterium RIFOXYA2_FULL_38_12 TaxID=1797993 RepID=A0A1F5S1E3_9BACT|nr:MAG: hypothetical protein A2257_04080 [Candidatus Falkowbacteria bacterium RIFOXYA2_FULL_38_12]OGF32939.1 MAG: hypothetical protein A2316_01650 [Candidatus Falkowbacteria bacterium RIFOXYB2_FULL_38_15]OGF44107.1 MAG: hypothetical protein A2555_01810 [Candidatus Falkowbacteria bacterium RIFOXYD2_FULL_39_16]
MRKIIVFTFILFFLFLARFTFAAETIFEIKNQTFRVGDIFEAGFFVNTEDEDINAIEGKIIFPEEIISLKEIRDGNSIINFWIDKPKNSNGEIMFSGIIPGGYSDKKGLVFSAVFQSLKEGQGIFGINNVKILKNDGEGTEANIKTSNPGFYILKQDQLFPSSIAPEEKDIEPPEPIELIMTSDPEIFNGKQFLVFSSQDKVSGIDHYEVCEGKKCVIAESPYLLENQNLSKEITVKAIDRKGNERVAILPRQKIEKWYERYLIFAIITILVIVIGYLISIILWRGGKK